MVIMTLISGELRAGDDKYCVVFLHNLQNRTGFLFSLCLLSFPPLPYLGDEFAICLRYERYDKQLSKQNKNK